MWLKLHVVQVEKEEDPMKTSTQTTVTLMTHSVMKLDVTATGEVKLGEPVRLLRTLLYITFA